MQSFCYVPGIMETSSAILYPLQQFSVRSLYEKVCTELSFFHFDNCRKLQNSLDEFQPRIKSEIQARTCQIIQKLHDQLKYSDI